MRAAGAAAREVVAEGLDLVPSRALTVASVETRFLLRPGDLVRVGDGDDAQAGTILAERLRDPRVEELAAALNASPGDRWSGELPVGSGLRRRSAVVDGELLFESGGQWRLVTGEHAEPLESPTAGKVRSVRPGSELVVEVTGRALPGVAALGDPARGRLDLATGPDGEIRPGSVDVGAAGTVLVIGSRVDAETLTRARAMGVRGVVVATLSGKERRDFLASEARQRAGLHRLPPFAVLVLDGTLRRPIATPVMRLLQALAGQDVAILTDPPVLVFDVPELDVPAPPRGFVRVRTGPLAGQEGTWAGLAGLRRFGSGAHLEAGFVRFADDDIAALPLADLERYG